MLEREEFVALGNRSLVLAVDLAPTSSALRPMAMSLSESITTSVTLRELLEPAHEFASLALAELERGRPLPDNGCQNEVVLTGPNERVQELPDGHTTMDARAPWEPPSSVATDEQPARAQPLGRRHAGTARPHRRGKA